MWQEVDENKEARKAELARVLLAGGRSFTEADADVFEGLSPREIQEYVAKTTQVSPRFAQALAHKKFRQLELCLLWFPHMIRYQGAYGRQEVGPCE